MQSKPLLIWQSVLAGLQIIAGGSSLADLVAPRWSGLIVLIVGAAQVGTATFIHGLVTIPQQTPVVVAQKDTPVEVQVSSSK